MKLKLIVASILLFLGLQTIAQRNILKYSGTNIDALENPQRQLFDSCKSWATNFPLFLPTLNLFDTQLKGDIKNVVLGYVFGENLDSYVSELDNNTGKFNRFIFDNTVTPFFLRIRTNLKKKAEFSFFTQIKLNGQLSVKNEAVNYLFRGNGPYQGQTLNGYFDTETFGQAYVTLNLGYRRNINEKLGIGGTLSLINGLAYFGASVRNSYLTTGPDYDFIEMFAQGKIRSSVNPDSVDPEVVLDDFLGFKNFGLGVSIGAQYQLTPTLLVDFSIKDLGYIRWNSSSSLQYNLNRNLRFEGVNIEQPSEIQDSLFKKLTQFNNDTLQGPFLSYLPTTLNAGISYKPNKFFRTSLVVSNQFAYKDLDFALIGDLKLLGGLHLVGVGCISTNSFKSLGAQLLIRSRGADFYIGTEKLFNTIALVRIKEIRDYPYSLGSDINFGWSFRFGRCKKSDAPTPPPVNPYRDTDGDGVIDAMDNCPYIYGPTTNQGCPIVDQDNDGVLDSIDKCPTIKGSMDNNGCPYEDSDGDGVLDKDDKCPTLKGPIVNKGCPFQDTDGDGVLDSLDKCPNVPGLIELEGCPQQKKVELTKEEEQVINKVFKSLVFKPGKTEIDPISYISLNNLAELLIKKTNFKLLIEGHTDNTGNPVNNIRLSQARSEAVATYLVARGIARERLITLGYGAEKPVATNKTPEGRAKNRRVEFTIVE